MQRDRAYSLAGGARLLDHPAPVRQRRYTLTGISFQRLRLQLPIPTSKSSPVEHKPVATPSTVCTSTPERIVHFDSSSTKPVESSRRRMTRFSVTLQRRNKVAPCESISKYPPTASDCIRAMLNNSQNKLQAMLNQLSEKEAASLVEKTRQRNATRSMIPVRREMTSIGDVQSVRVTGGDKSSGRIATYNVAIKKVSNSNPSVDYVFRTDAEFEALQSLLLKSSSHLNLPLLPLLFPIPSSLGVLLPQNEKSSRRNTLTRVRQSALFGGTRRSLSICWKPEQRIVQLNEYLSQLIGILHESNDEFFTETLLRFLTPRASDIEDAAFYQRLCKHTGSDIFSSLPKSL